MDLPLDVRVTAFQKKIWQTLRQIPSGKRAVIPRLRARSEIRKQYARWPGPARRIQWRGCALSSRGAQRRRAGGIPLGSGAQEEAAGSGAGTLLTSVHLSRAAAVFTQRLGNLVFPFRNVMSIAGGFPSSRRSFILGCLLTRAERNCVMEGVLGEDPGLH